MKNIVLIGMPSSGKSTLGVILAKTLGVGFVDTDLIIQKQKGRLLQEIIDTDGINKFLEIEEAAILSSEFTGEVIATGGSAIFCDKAMEYLKENGIIIYLNLPYDVIVQRLKNITTRGVAAKKGQTILDIYNQRTPIYEKYCDINIRCENETVEKSVEKIIKELQILSK
ncbi:MAG: shikimate kinase [Clostridiales bacterium]|jgi:shikimate kinase|nr:shikimate kinase [Clostridiales bacterium]